MRKSSGQAFASTTDSSGSANSPVALSGDFEVAAASQTLPFAQRVKASPSLAAVAATVVFSLIGIAETSQFLNGNTWINILQATSFTAIVACFESVVMISGALDLSVGSIFLAGAMGGGVLAEHHSLVTVFLGVVVIGCGIGLINGFLVSYLELNSIIVTLGMMFAVTAVVTTLSGGMSIGPFSPEMSDIGQATWGPIPVVIFYAIAVAVLAHIVLEYSTFGMRIRAVGGNRGAAAALGLNPRRALATVYVLSGLFAALAGLLQAANLGAANPTFGSDLELQAIAAAVIGGTSMYGAVGTIPGAVIGSILLGVLTTGLVVLHVNGTMQDFFIGVILILAIGFDRFRKTRMFRASIDRET